MAKTEKKKLQIESKSHWDETFRLMSWWEPEVVQKGKVLVVGAGALGNEVLKNLALMNVGNIFIMDFDTIEYANLSRSVLFREEDARMKKSKSESAADRIREINPNISVVALNGDITYQLGLGVIRRCDVVIACLDNRIARLYINRFCSRLNKPWVDGAIENLAGTLMVCQKDRNCYECNLTETEWKHIRFRLGCPDVANRNIKLGKIPTTPISASIIGAIQVQEAIKIIHKNFEQIDFYHKFYYEGMNNVAMWIESHTRSEECESHQEYSKIIEGKKLSADMLLDEFFHEAKKIIKKDFIIQLDTELVLEFTSNVTEESFSIVVPKSAVNETLISKHQSQVNEDFIITKSLTTLSKEDGLGEYRLYELGIPTLGIVNLETDDNIYHVELTKDLIKYPLLK